MKRFLFPTLLMSAAVALPLSQANAAPFAGSQSDDTNLSVGMSVIPFGPHSYGNAGIGVGTGWFSQAQKVDFQGLASSATQVYEDQPGEALKYTVYQVNDPDAEDHDGLGVFNFAQAGSGDVWYGEWSSDGGPNYTDRAVYYIGDKANTTMPSAGEATYAVNGINRYTGGAPLSGSFTAKFTEGTLKGAIDNGSLGIDVDATISGSSFDGTARAFNPATSATLDGNGVSEGEFYGNDAAALAGMATFVNNSQYDTAFGGERTQ